MDLDNLLHAIIRMEHKCAGSMEIDEYASAVRLCQEVEAPQFITQYFARKFVNGAWDRLSSTAPKLKGENHAD